MVLLSEKYRLHRSDKAIRQNHVVTNKKQIRTTKSSFGKIQF
jgi:hypothetical protein